jgi:hypothetical protein
MGTVTNKSKSHRAVNVTVGGVGRCIQLTPGVTKTLDHSTFVALRDHEYTKALIAGGLELEFVDDFDPFTEVVEIVEVVETSEDVTEVETPSKKKRARKKRTSKKDVN